MKNIEIGVVGQGYVGLPLAIEFGKLYQTIGFDISKTRIDELNCYFDKTKEASPEMIKSSNKLRFSNKIKDLRNCNVYIITVPTPIDKFKTPDLSYIKNASSMIGGLLNKEDIVIYESTVFPGCTEVICVPILVAESNLKFNDEFYCGYSPVRIVPGDKTNTLTKIIKVTSGSNKKTADFVDDLYSSIIEAGTHKTIVLRLQRLVK